MISRRDRRRSVASVVNTKSRSESRAIERRKTKQKDLEKQLLRLKEQEKKRQERHKYKLQHMTKREKDSRRKGHKARFLENIVNASYDRDMEADISEKHNLNEDSSILDVNTEEFIVNSGRSMGDMLHGVVEAARIQREMEEAKTEAERLRRERENMERYNKPVHLKELDEENKLASLNFDKPSVEVEMMKTEFHSAVKRGDHQVCKYLLANVKNVTDRVWLVNSSISKSGSTAIFSACWDGHLKIVKLLIDNGAKVKWRNLRNHTCLHMAIEQSHIDIIRYLIKQGVHCSSEIVADIRRRCGKKVDPRIDELIAHCPSDAVHVRTPLGDLVLRNDIKAIKHLLRNTRRQGSVIHHAHRPSVSTSIPAVPEASTITAPALPAVLPSSGSGGAGSTIGNGHHRRKSSVLSLGGKKSTRSRRKVLTACVDLVNERDEFGNTVLFSAASLGNVGCVNVLLEYKADLEMINDAGHTSLHLAIAHNHPNVVRVLLSRGADSGNVSMPMMRLWSPTNITTRIDDLLKQFPARKKIKPIDSSIDLSQEELKKLKQSFDYLDQEGTGYIGLKELQRFISLEGASLSRALVLASSSFEGGRAKNLVSFQDFVNVLYGGTRGRTKKRQAKQRSVNHHNTLENLQDQRQRLLTGNRAASPRYTGDDATPADDDDVEETDVAGIGSNHNGGETKRVYKSKFMRFTM